jgi:hypothetical protein
LLKPTNGLALVVSVGLSLVLWVAKAGMTVASAVFAALIVLLIVWALIGALRDAIKLLHERISVVGTVHRMEIVTGCHCLLVVNSPIPLEINGPMRVSYFDDGYDELVGYGTVTSQQEDGRYHVTLDQVSPDAVQLFDNLKEERQNRRTVQKLRVKHAAGAYSATGLGDDGNPRKMASGPAAAPQLGAGNEAPPAPALAGTVTSSD